MQMEKKKERETWTLLNTAYRKKKKERTDIFSKIDSTSLHRLKKRRKENWTFLNCDCNIVLTCKVEKFFESEFKGDIRKFFFLFILWNLTKTTNRGFYSRFTNICNYIDSKFFFRIWGFSGIGNIFWGVSVFEEIVGWRERGLQIVVESNSIEEFAAPWGCWGPIWLLFFLVWSSEDGIKEKRRGLLQNFVDDVYVFQSRWCFGFVCDLAKWNGSGKGEMPIYW